MPALGERLAGLETDVKNIKTSVEKTEKHMEKFIETADKKFASKLTERIVYGLCGLVLVAFATKLLNFW